MNNGMDENLTSNQKIVKEKRERWKREILVYRDRINRIKNWSPIEDSTLLDDLPNIPLNYEPSPQGLAAVRISTYVLNNTFAAHEASKAFVILWRLGQFTTISLPVRQIYELWGSSHYVGQLLSEIDSSKDIEKINRKLNRLLLGARSEVDLPWGGLSEEKSINVMDFIRSLTDTFPEAEKTYDFLCESCHPSFLKLVYMAQAGPLRSNWENEPFNNNGHKLLNNTLMAIETAQKGLAQDTKTTLEAILKYIRKEAPIKENLSRFENVDLN